MLLEKIKDLYGFYKDYTFSQVASHEGGRNLVYICKNKGRKSLVVRISMTQDRLEKDYQAELKFVHYLAENGASVADVIPSKNGNLVENIIHENKEIFVSCFEYAPGMLISDNGYNYVEGHPLSEYFYNTGKVLGKIHQLSKNYVPQNKRQDYFEKYNMEYINQLIPDKYKELKGAISQRLEKFRLLSKDNNEFGLVHFDFSDGNYHIDMSDGKITVFDFDNCIYCWYMFDLANLWTHGVGWFQFEQNNEKRKEGIKDYFNTVIKGYRTETSIDDKTLENLPLFIDMVLIENIVDEFECCKLSGEELDYEDIKNAADCLTNNIKYAGFFS